VEHARVSTEQQDLTASATGTDAHPTDLPQIDRARRVRARLSALGRSLIRTLHGDSGRAMPGPGGSVGRRGQARPTGPRCERPWPGARRSGLAAISACPLRPRPALDRTRRSCKSRRGRYLSRELTRWLQALFLQMPGTYRRVFGFTCIADLCDGYLNSRSNLGLR
jgi:hypothetical protein